MELDGLAHLVFLGNRTNVPMSNIEVFACCEPGLMLGHEPDLVL